MKRALLILLAIITLQSAYSQGRGEVVKGTVKSKILGVEKPYVVYLPAGFDKSSNKKYPVLYLLHGAWNDCNAWTVKGQANFIADQTIASQMAVPMIIVMPDAKGKSKNFAGKNMGYFNQEGWRYEDFFFNEFIPEIEKRYNIDSRKERRAVAGLSMGGGGAVCYAQQHPDMFCASAPLSGLVGIVKSGTSSRRKDGRKDDFTESFVKSTMECAPIDFIKNATPEQVGKMKSVSWYIDCGDDDFLATANVELYLEMKKKGIPMQFRVRDGGHTWLYWRSALPEVMKFVSIQFNK